jgi:acyl-CoA thioester hydrolase
MPTSVLIPTFTAAVNAWQCDENAHLNVQFYTGSAHEASAHLMAALGFGPRAQASYGLTLCENVCKLHYLSEFRVIETIETIEVRSAPVELGEHHLLVYHEVRNARRIRSPRRFAGSIMGPRRSVGTLELPALTLADATCAGLNEVERS